MIRKTLLAIALPLLLVSCGKSPEASSSSSTSDASSQRSQIDPSSESSSSPQTSSQQSNPPAQSSADAPIDINIDIESYRISRNGIVFQYMPKAKSYKVIGLEKTKPSRLLYQEGVKEGENGIEVEIPDEIDGEGVTGIADEAFAGEDVTSITLPDALEDIGNDIVDYSDKFEFNEYENGLYIGSSENPYLSLAKLVDPSVEEFHIHPNCEFLMHGCFQDCDALTDVYFNDHLRQIANVFVADIYTRPSSTPLRFHLPSLESYCSIDMTRFYIPRPIGYFVDGVHLDELIIPEGITQIGDTAFSYGDFSSLILPEGLRELGYQSFSRCGNLKRVSFPSTLERMGGLCFAYGALESLDLPSSLKIIPFGAFEDNNLTALTFPEGLEVIEADAFGMNHIASIQFPDSLVEIGRSAFWHNFELTEVILPPNLSFFNSDVFNDTNVNFTPWGDAYYLGTKNNPYEVLVSHDFWTWGHGDPSERSDVPSVSLHPDCKHLASAAFEGTLVEEVTLNEGLQSIGWAAFLRCENLKKVNIPSSVTYFGDAIFQEDELLKQSVNSTPESESIDVKYLGNDENPYLYLLSASTKGACPSFTTRPETRAIASEAFLPCSHIGVLTITGNVTTIEQSGIANVEIDELILEEGIKTIGLIFNCPSLSTLTLPSSCVSFGGCGECRNLDEINLSQNLVELGQFNNCMSLRYIIVPECVEEINSLAYNCPSLELIYIPETTRVKGILYELEIGKDESMTQIAQDCFICFEAVSAPNDFSTYFRSDLDNVTALWGFSFEE